MPQEGLISYCLHKPYTHRCQDCDKIHICCEHCNQILETIENECPECRLYKGQGVYSRNHPASAALCLQIKHDLDGTSGNGQPSSEDCCQKRSLQTCHMKGTGTFPDSVQLGVEGRMGRESMCNGTTVFSVKDAKIPDTDVPNVNHGNHIISSHPLDDPLFDHPDLKFIRDVNEWAGDVDNSTESASPQYHQQKAAKEPKTTRRNKNCLPKTTGISRPSGTSPRQIAAGNEERKQGPDKQQQATGDRLTNFKETMSGLGLAVKDVAPDGNCFFAAVVDQLRVRGEFIHTVKSLREAAVNYLRAYPNQEDGTPLQEFISDEGITSWDDYLNKQSKEGTWADHIIIGAISNVLRRRLVICSTRNTHPPINITVVKPRKVQAKQDGSNGSPNYEVIPDVSDEESTHFGSRSSRHMSHPHKLEMEQHHLAEQPKHSKLTEKAADIGSALAHLVSEIHTSHTDRSLRSKSSQVKFTQTNRDAHAFERTAGSDSGDIKSTSSEQLIAPRPNTENCCERSLTDDTDFCEDLLLGHIPEAHYFSLRQNDWCEKLYNVYDSADEQNEAENNTTTDILSDDHLNFLFKYIQDGNFLVRNQHMKNEHVSFPNPLQHWYDCRGVGDRYNDLESCLWSDQVNNSSNGFDDEGVPQIWYTIYPNDILVSKEEKGVGQKQLIPDETGCKIGFLKLRPKNPSIWRNKVQSFKEGTFLKHLYLRENLATNKAPKILSLKCDWPEHAKESKEILLKFYVNSMDETHQKIGEAVRVLPVCSHGAFCRGCVEWQYSFAVVEYIICRTIITSESRFCYKVMYQFLKFIFEGSRMMSKDVTKAVFFHIVDGLDIGNNNPSFIDIFQSFLIKLKVFLGASCIPDFFFRTKNLIGECSYEEIRWHYARICVVSRNYLVYIFMFLDQTGLMGHFALSQCFEILLYNSQHKDDNAQKCFTSLAVMGAREWVINASMVWNFGKARLLIDRYFCDSSNDSGKGCTENGAIVKLHKEVLFNLPLQEQWLYAFYLEYTSGTPYLDYVCRHHQCKDLGEYFGESALQILITDMLGHLRNQHFPLPIDIVRQEGIASFAVQFVNCLQFQLPLTQSVKDASVASIHYFLTQHTDMILTNFTQNERCDNIVSFQKTISCLFQLFNILCHQYQCHQQGINMDLLFVYDKLCSCSPSASGYEWLSKEWARIGNTYKAQEAQMKANSLRSVGTTIC